MSSNINTHLDSLLCSPNVVFGGIIAALFEMGTVRSGGEKGLSQRATQVSKLLAGRDFMVNLPC